MKAPPKVLCFCSPSGGHLNPAVTFSLCLLGREPWRKLPLFFFFQTLGAFLGAAVVFGMYIDALWDFSHGKLVVVGTNATAGIFATYPSEHLGLVNGFFDQIIGTAALIVCVLAIVDPNNKAVPGGVEPFAVGLVVANTYWFFVPVCAPFLGAVVGVLCYQLMIGYHLEGEVKKKQKEEEEEEGEEEEEEERLKHSSMTTIENA
ncbi:Aquaporin-3 [Liparis tanakae]|uniref:Aquaporin-3 n=1 Tax=Liparis tanakae TaxID=230148 RepID=A0A4Z2GDB4_9TELE|nr:Aquaporin-3 [Liparis tanakae]